MTSRSCCCCSLASLILSVFGGLPGCTGCLLRRSNSAYSPSSFSSIALLSCHLEKRYQPANPIRTKATRLPIRKKRLRLIQAILHLERTLESHRHAESEGAGRLVGADLSG